MTMNNDPYDKVKTEYLCDMSVTAGAGAGKTTALKSRYFNIIASGRDGSGKPSRRYKPSDITAVTFTKKAANEMKQKISDELMGKLNTALKERKESDIIFYKELKDELETADITTLHALCTGILREHPHEAGVDPEFGLIDDKMNDVLLDDVIVESIQDGLQTDTKATAYILEMYGFKGTVDIVKMLFRSPYLTEKTLVEPLPGDVGDDDARSVIESLKEFFVTVRTRYNKVKRDAGVLDFDDLEMITKRMLEGNIRIRRHYQSRIKFLMVDEFQDTNPIQKEIIYLLANRGDTGDDHGKRPYLFIVGDPKQSIYKFRNADVEIFNRVKKEIGADNALYLLKNFRSHEKIIDFINIFFNMYMHESENEFETGYEPLLYGRDELPPAPEGEPISRVKCLFFDNKALDPKFSSGETSLKSDPDTIAKPSALEARGFEAKLIANEISRLLSGEVKVVREEGNTLRAAKAGDIMVLFSAMTNVEIYIRELKSRGIPFIVSSGTQIFNKSWICDQVNLLRVADNILDDVALCGVLRSPFVLLSDTALFAISLKEGGSLYEKLVKTIDDAEIIDRLSGFDRERLQYAMELIGRMNAQKPRLKVSEFINHFLKATGYLYVMSARDDGELILDDIRAFMQIVELVEIDPKCGMKRVIEHIEQLRDYGAKMSTTKPVNNGDKVRLMSIHAAKGLESKVVFVADVSRATKNSSERVLLNEGAPVGVKVKDTGSLRLQETEGYATLKTLEAQRNLAENKRRLYVAATRAVDYLVFSGNVKFSSNRNSACSEAPVKHWMDAFKSMFEIHEEEDMPKGDVTVEERMTFIDNNGTAVKRSVACSVEFLKDYDIDASSVKDEPFKSRYSDNLTTFSAISVAAGETPGHLNSIFAPLNEQRTFNYTVTMLNAFKKCKRLFYYKYVYGIPEYGFLPEPQNVYKRAGGKCAKTPQNLDPAQKGNIVHKALESWTDYGDGYGAHLDKAIMDSGKTISDDDRAELVRLLENFSDSELFERLKSADEVMREVSFIMTVGGKRVISKLDCLYRHDGRWRLLDYKTEHADDIDAAAQKYRCQLELYGLSAAKALGIDSITAELFFLEPAKIVGRDVDISATEGELTSLLDDIQAYDSKAFAETPCKNESCDNCGYVSICQGNVKGFVSRPE